MGRFGKFSEQLQMIDDSIWKMRMTDVKRTLSHDDIEITKNESLLTCDSIRYEKDGKPIHKIRLQSEPILRLYERNKRKVEEIDTQTICLIKTNPDCFGDILLWHMKAISKLENVYKHKFILDCIGDE